MVALAWSSSHPDSCAWAAVAQKARAADAILRAMFALGPMGLLVRVVARAGARLGDGGSRYNLQVDGSISGKVVGDAGFQLSRRQGFSRQQS